MGGDWGSSTLDKAGVTLLDCVHKTPADAGSGIPYIAIPQIKNGCINFSANPRLISTSDYEKWTIKAKPQADDIVLSRRCNPGETAYVPHGSKFALGQNLVLLRSSGEKVFPPFLRWLVRGPEWWSQVSKFLNVGAVFDSLRCAEIPKFELLLPPFPEQKAIAHILGSLDDKIELNRQMNETLESMAQALFKSWFVDFDPVIDNALAAGNPIPDVFAERAEQRQNTKHRAERSETMLERSDDYPKGEITNRVKTGGVDSKNTSKNIQTQFPGEFEYTEEMGWIPKGWRVSQIKDFGRVITGKTPPKKVQNSYCDGGTPFITPTDVDNSLFVITTNRYLTSEGEEAVKSSNISAGTICVTCIGSQMGKTIITPIDSFTNQQINSIEVKNRMHRNYLFLNLRRLKEEIFLMGSSGSTMPIINKSTFEKISLILPAEELLALFQENIGDLLNSVLGKQIENQTLTKLRDTLLPKLLSGEIRIPDAVKLIKEAK